MDDAHLLNDEPATRRFLRHTVATLAYRAGKAVRNAPAAFGAFRATQDSPTSVEILAHMGDLMDWVLRMARGEERWTVAAPLSWEREIERFFSALEALDAQLASNAPLGRPAARIFQGGIADALTHTGQLAMLRRLAGHKMKGENYSKAKIEIGRVGLDQFAPDARVEFD
jgi:hypothetical protein